MAPMIMVLPPDGTSLTETCAYLTDVLTAFNGTEQRIQLRGLPQMAVGYGYTAAERKESQLAEALLNAGGADDFIVPLWQFPRRLTAPAAERAISVSAGLAGLPRLPQGATYRFILWRDQDACEAIEASAWTDTAVTLLSPTTTALSWPSGAYIFPALVGRLATGPGRSRIGPLMRSGSIALDADLLGAAYAAGTPGEAFYAPAGYLGIDVLTGLPCGSGPPDETYNRRVTVVGGAPGVRALDAQDSAAGWTRQLLVKCDGAAEVESLRAFLDVRKGRAVPFWLPTWDGDLTLTQTYTHDGTPPEEYFNVVHAGYAELLFPLGPQRRHLAARGSSGALYYRRVTDASYDGVGPETVTFVTPLGENLPAGAWLSYLRYVRLDTDSMLINWFGSAYATCQFPVREIPLECPA